MSRCENIRPLFSSDRLWRFCCLGGRLQTKFGTEPARPIGEEGPKWLGHRFRSFEIE